MAIYPGQGTILKATTQSNSLNSTAIFQIVELDGPGMEQPKIRITNLGDTSEKYRMGLPDAQPITGTLQYDPANNTHSALTTLINMWPQVTSTFTEIFPTVNNSPIAFTGYMAKFSPKGMNEDDNFEADFEIQPTGLLTWPTN